MNRYIRILGQFMCLCMLALFAGLLCSCNFHDGFFVSGSEKYVPEDPFGNPPEYVANALSTKGTQPSDFSFLLITDPHFIRPDKGTYYATDAFFRWLEHKKDSLEFAINLGDVTDDSLESEFKTYQEFTEKLKNTYDLPCFSVVGNHDNRKAGPDLWNKYVQTPPYYRFVHKEISFYMLDSSSRTLGKRQMEYLKAAIAEDPNKKLFCSHIPLYGKADLFYFAMSDTQERNLIIKLMMENDVGMYLSGHHHKGDVIYRYSDTCSEFIAGAFHGRDSIFEGPARWYICNYGSTGNTLTITRYTKYTNTDTTADIEETLMGTFQL